MSTISAAAIANLEAVGLGEVLYVPGKEKFDERVASYWSLTAQLKPWAIVQPRNTEEVARAVKALVGTKDCEFAVRGGGHTVWAGASNIEQGITIDLGLLTATTYDPSTKLASLSPGARWADVYTEVEKHGVMVAGGREGLVGVGGLLLGGGKTFYTCRLGFACDQVVNYEVVLADGSIVQANGKTNPDLFRVLKGGSNNFGIATRFDVATFPAAPIWDGNVLYTRQDTDALIAAFVDFTQNLTATPDAHVLLMWSYNPLSKSIFVMAMLTHLDGVVNAPSLRKFTEIKRQGGTSADGSEAAGDMQVKSVAEKVNAFLLPSGQEDIWLTVTFKLDAQGKIIKKATDVHEKLVAQFKALIPDGNFTVYLVMQPFCASFAAHSVARGGNMFGTERIKDDCVLMIAAVEVPTPELKEAGFPIFKAGIDEIEAFAKACPNGEGRPQDMSVEFRYLNYCDGSQNPLATYGEENIKKMKDAAVKYDPTGVFQTRVPGGFKISKV